jgi:hypothetical protein
MDSQGDDIKYVEAFSGVNLLIDNTFEQGKSRFGVRFSLLYIFSYLFVV